MGEERGCAEGQTREREGDKNISKGGEKQERQRRDGEVKLAGATGERRRRRGGRAC